MVRFRWLQAVFAATAFISLVANWREWNFDCIGYAGAARQSLGESLPQVHTTVYRELEAVAPQDRAEKIEQGSEYRKVVHEDWRAFALQLPFYASKPLYICLIAFATRLGANSVDASFWTSAV